MGLDGSDSASHQDIRARVLGAAKALIVRHGDLESVEAVAAEAGVPADRCAAAFATVDAIAESLLEGMLREAAVEMSIGLSGSERLADAVTHTFGRLARLALREPEAYIAWLVPRWHGFRARPRFIGWEQGLHRMLRSRVDDAQRRGTARASLDPEVTTLILGGVLEALLPLALSASGEARIADWTHSVREFLERGLAGGAGGGRRARAPDAVRP